MKADLLRITRCNEADLHTYFEFFVKTMDKGTKTFGRNELYDFLNSFFGVTSPSFSDNLFKDNR